MQLAHPYLHALSTQPVSNTHLHRHLAESAKPNFVSLHANLETTVGWCDTTRIQEALPALAGTCRQTKVGHRLHAMVTCQVPFATSLCSHTIEVEGKDRFMV